MRTEIDRKPMLRGLSRSLLFGTLLLSGVAHADFKRDYEFGEKAFEDGDWAEAQRRFESALREQPQPNAKQLFTGVVRKPYVPHLLAGIAAYKQGNCERALALWDNTATDGVLAQVDALATRKRERDAGRADCQSKLGGDTRLAQQPATPATPVQTPAATPPSTAPTVASVPPATSKPPVAAPPPVATPQTPAATAVAAPAALRSAVEQYFTGRYADVLASNPSGLSDARARAQLHLLRAASAFTRAKLDNNNTLLETAQREVRSAKAAQAGLNPDSVAFSSAFRSFWTQTR